MSLRDTGMPRLLLNGYAQKPCDEGPIRWIKGNIPLNNGENAHGTERIT